MVIFVTSGTVHENDEAVYFERLTGPINVSAITYRCCTNFPARILIAFADGRRALESKV